MSCPGKTRSKKLLRMQPKLVEAVVVAEDRPPGEGRINVEEVNKVAGVVDLEAEDHRLRGVVATSPEPVVVEVEQQPRKIGTSGSTSYSIFETKTCCRLVYSSFPRSAARRMPRRFQTSTIATLLRRARYT
jgi:hypothetical protein